MATAETSTSPMTKDMLRSCKPVVDHRSRQPTGNEWRSCDIFEPEYVPALVGIGRGELVRQLDERRSSRDLDDSCRRRWGIRRQRCTTIEIRFLALVTTRCDDRGDHDQQNHSRRRPRPAADSPESLQSSDRAKSETCKSGDEKRECETFETTDGQRLFKIEPASRPRTRSRDLESIAAHMPLATSPRLLRLADARCPQPWKLATTQRSPPAQECAASAVRAREISREVESSISSAPSAVPVRKHLRDIESSGFMACPGARNPPQYREYGFFSRHTELSLTPSSRLLRATAARDPRTYSQHCRPFIYSPAGRFCTSSLPILSFFVVSDLALAPASSVSVRLSNVTANKLRGEFMQGGGVLDCCFHDGSSGFSASVDHTVRSRVCGNLHAIIIRKYGLMCCKQCFRSNAKDISFIKYRSVVGSRR
ncbi:40S ribosomal protein S29 [Striga asiatica]|uniref:40S ribosomal protein S29 n=1 Tax=Striga asiatica TaxID=4170 RepID=A0A5A7NW11_STRAF|nr:40S ribosomal protein S29 [Striga asiatica]